MEMKQQWNGSKREKKHSVFEERERERDELWQCLKERDEEEREQNLDSNEDDRYKRIVVPEMTIRS